MSYYISPEKAAALDEELMEHYSVLQLMEHAGLVVALAITKKYTLDKNRKIIVICGPGNNGGDGLVCARYLMEFGWTNIKIIFPGYETKQLKPHIQQQLALVRDAFQIQIDSEIKFEIEPNTIVVDAIVGFGSKGPLREPYQSMICDLNKCKKKDSTAVQVVCIDCPSGWDLMTGPIPNQIAVDSPDLIVSLTAPKPCTANVKVSHCVGGRFVPK